MELMDQLGLADRLLQLPHAKIRRLNLDAPTGPIELANLDRLPTKYPYITMMPQARFLDFLAQEMANDAVRAAGDGGERPGAALGRRRRGSGIADRAADAHGRRTGRAHPAGAAARAHRAAASGEHGTLPEDAMVRGVRYRSHGRLARCSGAAGRRRGRSVLAGAAAGRLRADQGRAADGHHLVPTAAPPGRVRRTRAASSGTAT